MKTERRTSNAAAWALALGCALAFMRCGHEQMAGSSVTTGNPTEIQVSLTDAGGPVALSGRVEIYAATQIPIPGFRPAPLARFDVSGKQAFTLNAGHFEGIADSMWAPGSLSGDTLARFNLIFTGDNQGSLLRDLGYRVKDDKFSLREGTWKPGKGGVAHVDAEVSPLAAMTAFIRPENLDNTRFNYLFLMGTGFRALSESGRFVFTGVPEGTHPLSYLSLPDKVNSATSEDTAYVYGLDKVLTPGKTDTLFTTAIDASLPLPAEYRRNRP